MRRIAVMFVLFAVAGGALAGERRIRTDRPAPKVLPLPAEEEAFSFVIFGDRTGGPPEGIEVLKEAVEDTNLLGPDLVVTVGDLIQGYNRANAWLAQMEEYRAVMDGLSMPWFPVAGNHDVYWRGGTPPPGHHENAYEKHFGPLWYWFGHKNAAFFVLYSDEGDPETNRKGWGNARVNRFSDAQLRWLEHALGEAKDFDHAFAFLHHPRWQEGYYPGSNWNEVHRRLVAAGNVTAVFAGHMHRQRYDGVKDGIAYHTLATSGGGIPFDVPGTGFLHHLNLVTVRPSGITVATLPVGSVLDPRDMTPEHLQEIDRIRGLGVDLGDGVLGLDGGFCGDGTLAIEVRNPATRSISLALAFEVEDRAWRFAPRHAHLELAPGAAKTLEVAWTRKPVDDLEAFRFPHLVVQADYLGKDLRISLPERRQELPWRLDGLPASVFVAEPNRAIRLGGRSCLKVEDARLRIPDGPFTVEGWVRPEDLTGRRGFLSKAERSEYGLFVSDGTPSFHVHVGGAYRTAQAPGPMLEKGRWHHVAGVFDGELVRLYVDGELIASRPAKGTRKRNDKPFLVGADPDRAGRAGSFLTGMVDEVRISKTARYTTSRFEPTRRHAPDADTLLLLHLDTALGPFWPDHGPGGRHALTVGEVANPE